MRHVLHLMQPDRPGGAATRVGRQGRMNRPRVAPGDTPQHASELNQAPVRTTTV
jgi:hypothetical protein